MFIKLQLKKFQFLHLLLLVSLGMMSISCTTGQNEAEASRSPATERPVPVVLSATPLTPTATVTAESLPTEVAEEATPTAVATISETTVITEPTLINLDISLETDNLPTYGWFSEDSQVVYFAYPEEGVTFSYNIVTQELTSTPLAQQSDEELIEQIAAELPTDARVWEISPRYQNILYTVPISQPVRLERGAFSVPLDNELWLYKDGESIRLGAVDECFLINLSSTILWSSSETFATVNAISPMACVWSNWQIDLEIFSIGPVYQTWEEELPAYDVAAILPDRQLLLNPLLIRKPSAMLDLLTQELTVFSNRGTEMAIYFDDTVFLDFIFWPGSDGAEDETEVVFSYLDETDKYLINTIEGVLEAKYVSPDQKQVLLFSGSSDYYGLSENQKSSGVWLLSFP